MKPWLIACALLLLASCTPVTWYETGGNQADCLLGGTRGCYVPDEEQERRYTNITAQQVVNAVHAVYGELGYDMAHAQLQQRTHYEGKPYPGPTYYYSARRPYKGKDNRCSLLTKAFISERAGVTDINLVMMEETCPVNTNPDLASLYGSTHRKAASFRDFLNHVSQKLGQ